MLAAGALILALIAFEGTPSLTGMTLGYLLARCAQRSADCKLSLSSVGAHERQASDVGTSD